MSRTVIGILAGMGPRTTAPFLERVLALCRSELGAELDQEFPDIVAYSLPTPYQLDQTLTDATMTKALTKGAAALARAGASFIVVPCNVAHLYFDSMKKGAGVPILHIVNETVNRLPEPDGVKLAVLATRVTHASRMFERVLEERGYELLDDDEQESVDALIAEYERSGVSLAGHGLWHELRERLREAGVTHVVNGCTDLAFCAMEPGPDLHVIDSSEALARAALREFIAREPLDVNLRSCPSIR